MKYLKTLLFISIFILFSCSNNKEASVKIGYIDVKELPEIEFVVKNNIPHKILEFNNTATTEKVSVLHHLENTSFHFYNAVKFKTENIGVMVGGTGLKTRITKDGGKSWNEFQFSQFSNAFHSLAFINNSLFIVGESNYIFRSTDLGKNWTVFDTKSISPKNVLHAFKFYKIRFLNDKLGFIGGEYGGKSILLKTTTGGKDWNVLEIKGLVGDESGISDFKILSDNEIIIVTFSGKCYKSNNQGIDWELLYEGKEETISLNSIDFKNSNIGCIGGLNGLLLFTDNGGKQWNKIQIPSELKKTNISNVNFVKGKLLITTASAYLDKEMDAFVYEMNEDGTNIQPFLTKNNNDIFFKGEAYGIDVMNDNIFIMDRNNLYQTIMSNEK